MTKNATPWATHDALLDVSLRRRAALAGPLPVLGCPLSAAAQAVAPGASYVDVTSLLFLLVVLMLVAGGILLPRLIEKRLVTLMFRRSEAMNVLPDEVLLAEVETAVPIKIVDVRTADKIAGADKARTRHCERWVAMVRRGAIGDLVAAMGYVLLPIGAILLSPGKSGDAAESGIELGLLFLVLVAVRWWVHKPSFSASDSQFGTSVNESLEYMWTAVKEGFKHGRNEFGFAIICVFFAVFLVSMPRLRVWTMSLMLLTTLVLADGEFTVAHNALTGAALAAAALLHLAITAHFAFKLQREPGLKLLVLRVFGIDDKAAFTFGNALTVWGFFGSWFTVIDPSYWRHANRIWSWAAVGRVAGSLVLLLVGGIAFDTVLDKVVPGHATMLAPSIVGLLILMGIGVAALRSVDSRCVRDRAHLKHVMAGLRRRPRRLDAAFRHLEVPCYDNTWKIAVSEFAQAVDVVLMDLRGFSEARKGCEYEINFLLDVLPVDQVVFLVDDSSNRAQINRAITGAWQRLSVDSPNLSNPAPRARIFSAGREKEADVQGLLNLLISVADRKSQAGQVMLTPTAS